MNVLMINMIDSCGAKYIEIRKRLKASSPLKVFKDGICQLILVLLLVNGQHIKNGSAIHQTCITFPHKTLNKKI